MLKLTSFKNMLDIVYIRGCFLQRYSLKTRCVFERNENELFATLTK